MNTTAPAIEPTRNVPQEWLSRAEAEDYLRLRRGALAQMAYRHTGPKFKKMSYRHTLYRRTDLDAWIDAQDDALRQ